MMEKERRKFIHSMPLVFTIGLSAVGIGVFQMAYYIISISYNVDLWWQVIEVIDKSPFNLVLAYVMMAISIAMIVSGILLSFTRDKKV